MSLLKNFVADVSRLLNVKLDLNKFNACMIKLAYGVNVNLTLDTKEQNFVISAILGVIPHGPFRRDFFEKALQANGLPPPNIGKFAWSKKGDYFIIFEVIPAKDYNSQKAVSLLEPLALKAKIWRDALNSSILPLVEQQRKHEISLKDILGGFKLP